MVNLYTLEAYLTGLCVDDPLHTFLVETDTCWQLIDSTNALV